MHGVPFTRRIPLGTQPVLLQGGDRICELPEVVLSDLRNQGAQVLKSYQLLMKQEVLGWEGHIVTVLRPTGAGGSGILFWALDGLCRCDRSEVAVRSHTAVGS